MPQNWKEKAQHLALEVRNFVNGHWEPQRQGLPLEKLSPRDGTLLYRMTSGMPADADHAVAVARIAFEDGRWSQLSAHRWKEVLFKLASLIDENREHLALLECLDVGKPI